ncbi:MULTISPECIES: glycosyltransferase family 4 protein [unclassified Thioalkalivibrio]|uniref:glycosyltransferase family 4 protein n=1 Tax=unclassified Thioalkalivibrio TaxID=2621013 RepID=UPI0003826712|nr:MULTISPECIES: glycosyltransferase family 4 protein [unclassified Thioalkalivibrio]
MKTVMLCTDNGLETVGGEQESTRIIAEYLQDQFRMVVVQPGRAPDRRNRVEYRSVAHRDRLKKVFRNPFSVLAFVLRLRRLVCEERPDLIHTQGQASLLAVVLLRRCRVLPGGSALVHTERGIFTKYGPVVRGLLRWALRDLDAMVCTTELNRRYWEPIVRQVDGALRIQVIGNPAGPAYEGLGPRGPRRDAAGGRLVVGFSGRYADWKDWPLAVEIVRRVEERVPGVVEWHMAVGCSETSELRAVEAMFRALEGGLGQRFVGEVNRPPASMVGFYEELDVFVLTTKPGCESFGRVLVEAMSSGCAVLSTDSGGPQEVIGDVRFIHNDAPGFATALVHFLLNPGELLAVAARNQARVRQHYSLEYCCRRHIELYTEVL